MNNVIGLRPLICFVLRAFEVLDVTGCADHSLPSRLSKTVNNVLGVLGETRSPSTIRTVVELIVVYSCFALSNLFLCLSVYSVLDGLAGSPFTPRTVI